MQIHLILIRFDLKLYDGSTKLFWIYFKIMYSVLIAYTIHEWLNHWIASTETKSKLIIINTDPMQPGNGTIVNYFYAIEMIWLC